MTPERSATDRLDEVERHEDGGRWTLVFVRTLRHPPERVWAASPSPRSCASGRRTTPTGTSEARAT